MKTAVGSKRIGIIIRRLQKAYPEHPFLALNGRDPYRLLISCILSLRTQDAVSLPATTRLFGRAKNIAGMQKLSSRQIERLIYPVGFYRKKAQTILALSHLLAHQFKGRVPTDQQTLLGFPGVGRKTANLVLSLGYGVPAICVDTHVHRIANRIGWVVTKTPEQTEGQLMKRIPKRYWISLNSVLVRHGQTTCRPQRPRCSQCVVKDLCRFGIKQANL